MGKHSEHCTVLLRLIGVFGDFSLMDSRCQTALPDLAHISNDIADVFPAWHCVHTHLCAPEQRPDKTPAVIEALTLTMITEAMIWSAARD